MITAKNYAAQVEKSCREFGGHCLKKGMAADARSLLMLERSIAAAQHFAIPDRGVIFNDNLKGAAGLNLRMPYEMVTIEYYMPPDGDDLENGDLKSTKRMALCIDTGYAMKHLIPANEEGTLVIPFWDSPYGWGIQTHGLFVPRQWDDLHGAIAAPDISILVRPAGAPFFATKIITLLSQTVKLVSNAVSKEDFDIKIICHIKDMSSEVRAVLEFFEALSCSNVTATPIEKVDPAKNARRIRDGKLPLYETKVLTVDCPSARYPRQSTSEPSNRASPREHLRRGHIRRLENGNRIWVNSAVIGSAGMGRIDKRYKIRSAA